MEYNMMTCITEPDLEFVTEPHAWQVCFDANGLHT